MYYSVMRSFSILTTVVRDFFRQEEICVKADCEMLAKLANGEDEGERFLTGWTMI